MKNTNRRPTRQNRITPPVRVWTLARIPAAIRALIDAEAQKWNISTGDAISRLVIGRGVAA